MSLKVTWQRCNLREKGSTCSDKLQQDMRNWTPTTHLNDILLHRSKLIIKYQQINNDSM